MDNTTFSELKIKLAALPVLEQRFKSLTSRLVQGQTQVQNLLNKYQSEALDVDKIQKDSLSNTLLKMIGKYDDKVNKETQEMLTAKLEYDKATAYVKELENEKQLLSEQLNALNKDRMVYEKEMNSRETAIKSKVSEEAYLAYSQIQLEHDSLAQQIVETEEAIRAASKVTSAAAAALQHLEKAEGWATYDVWGGGGIITHMAKYDHIDEAQAQLNRLSSLSNDFRKELADVNMQDVLVNTGIDSTSRTIDFFFDNIFTDMRVRDKIRDDIYQIQTLSNQVNNIIRKLEANKSDLNTKVRIVKNKKDELLMSFEI